MDSGAGERKASESRHIRIVFQTRPSLPRLALPPLSPRSETASSRGFFGSRDAFLVVGARLGLLFFARKIFPLRFSRAPCVVSRYVPLLHHPLLLRLFLSLSVAVSVSLFLRCPFPFRVSLSVCVSPFSSACCNPFCETSCARTRRRGKSERAVDREPKERERRVEIRTREYHGDATGMSLDDDDAGDDSDEADRSPTTPETDYRWDTTVTLSTRVTRWTE